MQTIRMPRADRGADEATIGPWAAAEGKPLAEGDTLVRIEGLDAVVELQSPRAGTLLKVLVSEGTVVPVGTPLCAIGDPGEDISQLLAEAGEEEVIQTPEQAATSETEMSEQTAPAAAKAPPEPEKAGPPAAGGDVTPILMPQVGNTMEEGTVVEWKVSVGDEIEKGQIIFDVETDKATVEVEAADSGRLARILVPDGETVPVKAPVAYLAASDADVDAYLAAQGEAPAEASPAQAKPQAAKPAAKAAPAAPKTAAPTTGAGRVKASPAARKLAAERGIDLAALGAGSGPGGRIVSSDVPADAPRRRAAAPTGEATRHEMTSMRRAIGRGLLWSKQNIPHFYMKATIDAEPLWAAYQQVKAAGEFKCTVNDFVVAACAKALQEFPPLRMKLDENALVETAESNIGIAVGTEDGLLVPVLAGAERLSFGEIAAESRRLVGNARNGKLEGVGLGVFTVTNLGMFGVEEFSAIINPPEAAILAVGAIREDVVVRDGAIRPRRVMTMTLSADHRIVDGLVGAQFCARLKELLEAPERLL